MAEHDTWKRKEDLGNTREAIKEFKERMSTEVKWQEKCKRFWKNDIR